MLTPKRTEVRALVGRGSCRAAFSRSRLWLRGSVALPMVRSAVFRPAGYARPPPSRLEAGVPAVSLRRRSRCNGRASANVESLAVFMAKAFGSESESGSGSSGSPLLSVPTWLRQRDDAVDIQHATRTEWRSPVGPAWIAGVQRALRTYCLPSRLEAGAPVVAKPPPDGLRADPRAGGPGHGQAEIGCLPGSRATSAEEAAEKTANRFHGGGNGLADGCDDVPHGLGDGVRSVVDSRGYFGEGAAATVGGTCSTSNLSSGADGARGGCSFR